MPRTEVRVILLAAAALLTPACPDTTSEALLGLADSAELPAITDAAGAGDVGADGGDLDTSAETGPDVAAADGHSDGVTPSDSLVVPPDDGASGGDSPAPGDDAGGGDLATDPGAEDVVADPGAEDVAADPGAEDVVADPGPVQSVTSALITSPATGTAYTVGDLVGFAGAVSDSVHAADLLTISWSSSLQGELGSSPADAQGMVGVSVSDLVEGAHQITLVATTPTGQTAQDTIIVVICPVSGVETFDVDQTGGDWKVYGDAYWDPGGWLEMTGPEQSKAGAIFNISGPIDPGNVHLSFKIWTGGGINGGADGFAMSVIGASSVAELDTILAAAGNGGCLGYGVSGACGDMTIDGFHVEFDTFNNQGDPFYDPTFSNHVGVTLDGDPGDHVLWSAVTLEDSAWHTVVVKVSGVHVTVTFDDQTIIDDDVPGLIFHGGYIGFTGTTGWASNYHRFDDLQILKECTPDP